MNYKEAFKRLQTRHGSRVISTSISKYKIDPKATTKIKEYLEKVTNEIETLKIQNINQKPEQLKELKLKLDK